MNDKDKAAFDFECHLTKGCSDQFRIGFANGFKTALAHRDEQIKGLVEALEQFCSLIQHQYTGSQEAMSALQNADNKAQAALASYKEQTK